MLYAILSACLAADPQSCQPIVLTGQSFGDPDRCAAESARIAPLWAGDDPGLVADDPRCAPLADLPALPVERIAEGVYVHLGQAVQYEDSPDGRIANLGFVVGRDSIAVIDAGTSRQQGQALFAAIRRISDKPISHLIVTHMHPDHAFGAGVFREAGATIVGHEQLTDALRVRGPAYLDNLTRLYGPAPMIGTRIVLPDAKVADTMTVDLGGRTLTLTAAGPAHTDNDVTVRDSATGTLFAGDLIFRDLTPIVDGSLPGWLGWMDIPQDAGPVVPGHGPVARDWDTAVSAQRQFLAALDRATRDGIAAGLPLSRAVPVIVRSLQPFADLWASFPESAARDATAAFKELEWE
ncbi:quinoprotein relay system zinc metallohydrolase 2 [Paracoccus sediminis]|uniref:Quinoprotein relay system zinc metallohydrolase 2 n=1 Tax=Paracoccus sediminis TaxID=1214787 RepID=A0A238VIS0_9RHOB|nr:quinoprotein relay system zinc metallohydrolase 2 [Paracoccus sediminis]TBN52153.1 quinoprotein relay system zinc metallohydrolase 2 [Paracoccus sediminis]SNR34074.1 quinoprotein relay system zinc metallohydrolase 2 [Paracoccus sediminis]